MSARRRMTWSGPGQGSTYERIYDVVRRVPRGRVVTYGQVATLAGIPGHARQVGREPTCPGTASSTPRAA
jgi:methylated-DNA-protein-cysteine methyltransferase-like protein